MGYVQELRQFIGSRPIILVGATLAVYDDQGRVLLQRRSDTGNWGLPGGAMEPGESIEGTARRELYEETGLEAAQLELLDVLSGPEFFFQYPNGDQIHTVIVLYEVTGAAGRLRVNDGESIELAYFPLDDLPELESRAAGVMKRLMSRRGSGRGDTDGR
jgi:8-oxo-dGTP pyrophosphatase MutT (NUDIX family)